MNKHWLQLFIQQPYFRHLLIACGLLCLLFHIQLVFLSFYNNDDLNYIRYAVQLANNGQLSVLTNDHFALRWGTIVLTAVCIKILGLNLLATCCGSLIAIGLTAYCIKWLMANANLAQYGLALFLFFFNYSTVFFAHRVLADVGVAACVAVAYTMYAKSNNGAKRWSYAVGFAGALLWAVITKETIVITIPLWMWLLTTDVLQKQKHHFWWLAVLLCVCGMVVYLGVFAWYTGNPWYRLKVLEQNAYLNECSYHLLPLTVTLQRIGYQLWQAFLLNGNALYFLPACWAFVYRNQIFSSAQTHEKRLVTAFVVLLLSSNFMSVSFTEYVPLCNDPRHFYFVMPFACIAASYMLLAYHQHRARWWMLPVCYAISGCLCSLSNADGGTKWLYFGAAVILGLHLIVQQLGNLKVWQKVKKYYVFAALSLVLVVPVADLRKPMPILYQQHVQIMQLPVFKQTKPSVVYTGNQITADISLFASHYQLTNWQFKSVDTAQIPAVLKADTNYWVLLPLYGHLQEANQSFSSAAQCATLGIQPVWQTDNWLLGTLTKPIALHTLKKFYSIHK